MKRDCSILVLLTCGYEPLKQPACLHGNGEVNKAVMSLQLPVFELKKSNVPVTSQRHTQILMNFQQQPCTMFLQLSVRKFNINLSSSRCKETICIRCL